MDDNKKEAVSDEFLNRFGIGWWASAGGQVFATMTREHLKELESYVNDLEKRLGLFKGANNSARVRLKYVEAELAVLKTEIKNRCGYCNVAASIFEATKSEPGS